MARRRKQHRNSALAE